MQFALSFAVLACLAVGLQAKEDCLCQFFLEGGTGIRNFVFGKGHKLDDFCRAHGEQHCINFCLQTYGKLTNGGDLTLPAKPYWETYAHAACGNMARDVYRKRIELYAQSCDGIIIPTGLVSKQELCCRGTEPYDCLTE